ncbi:MAG: polysaccharide deacetylase family protein [Candidatus Krumholzibacteriia bacterium]
MKSAIRTPVLMYHTTGRPLPGWLWSGLTTPMGLFQRQVDLLAKHGYVSISLDDLRERQESGTAGLAKEVVLTFDDGYLDNWVVAFPILKKLGWQGTIYVNTDFVDPGEEVRLNLEDVWAGRCTLDDLLLDGFLNRAELRALQASGVMTIAFHSRTHTWYPTSGKVVDYHRPGLETPWLAWNTCPDRKFAYLTENQAEFVPWGTPILEHGRSLGIRRFIPDPSFASPFQDRVRGEGGPAFFARPGWRRMLDDLVGGDGKAPGRLESGEEMRERFRDELLAGKEELEVVVGDSVRHFCWPGGSYCDESWEVADGAGFDTICVSRRDPRRWAQEDDPRLVRRIGSLDKVASWRGLYPTGDERFLLWACEIERGATWKTWPFRFMKLVTAARNGFSPLKT